MTNNEIVKAFANGATKGKANSMFIESRGNLSVIFSYGYHFPMAIKWGSKYLVNTDKYSMTTSRQQSKLRTALFNVGADVEAKTTAELRALL